MKRIIFLDIDGVLNNPGCYRMASGSHAPPFPPAVAALNRITDATSAEIVVSSSWRLLEDNPLPFLKEKLRTWGVTGSVIDTTPLLLEQNGAICISRHRGAEIGAWLDEHAGEVESFVILDDESDMQHLTRRLVKVWGAIGLKGRRRRPGDWALEYASMTTIPIPKKRIHDYLQWLADPDRAGDAFFVRDNRRQIEVRLPAIAVPSIAVSTGRTRNH